MKTSIEIIYAETETLLVKGFFHKARPMSRDRIDPPEDASFEIDEVFYKDTDITKILSDEDFRNIEEKCIEKIEN